MPDAPAFPDGFGVIFDMDGLMLDTESIARTCWERAFVENGYELRPDLFQTMIGRNKRDCLELLRGAFGPQFEFEKIYARCGVLYEAHVAEHGTPLMPGVLELLGDLSALGVPLAVATSTRNPAARQRLEKAGLLPFFQTVVAGSDVTNGKPAPDIYLEAVRRLKIDATRSFALEDSPAGVRAAHAAGLRVIMVPDLVPATEEIARLAHRVVPSLNEVRAVLDEAARASPTNERQPLPDSMPPARTVTPRVLPRSRTFLFLAGLVALGLALFLAFFYACGGWTLAVPVDLTIANGDEPQTLDPAIVTAQLDQRICLAIYEGLTSCDPAGHIVPGVAQSWEISPDGRTYTFHLRPDAQWSNGDPLTADDFLESWKRVLDPATASDYAYQLFYLVNGEAYYNHTVTDFAQVGVKAPDARTLVVTLSHPTAYFLQLTAAMQTLFPVHLATVRQYGDDWTKPEHIVGNGPYLLKSWRLNDSILLEANPRYWRPVAIKRIRVLPTRDANTCFNLFYSGKIDLILDQSSIPPVLLNDIRHQPYFHPNPIGATTFIRFNVKSRPFDDVRVRQALALALDKQDIVEKIIRTGEPVARTLVPPGNNSYIPPAGLGHDVEQARQLLAAAGYPGGRNFPDVTLLYATKGTGPAIATEMQALWSRDLGINSIHLRGQEFKVYLNSQASVDFDLSLSRWIGDYNDPQTFLDMFVTGGGNNETNWSDPAYDQMLADSENTPDPAQRMRLLQGMEKILVEDQVPVFPISFTVGAVLYHPGALGGFAPNFVDDHPWGDLYLPSKK